MTTEQPTTSQTKSAKQSHNLKFEGQNLPEYGLFGQTMNEEKRVKAQPKESIYKISYPNENPKTENEGSLEGEHSLAGRHDSAQTPCFIATPNRTDSNWNIADGV